MTLTEYLDGMRSARSPAELDAAIRAPFEHPFLGRTWRTICRVRIEVGERIVKEHPLGRFVPIIEGRRILTICGETCRVGYGQNSAGERWVWAGARAFVFDVLGRNGFGMRASHAIWEHCGGYPHRSLQAVENALAGKLPDPRFNRLIYRGRNTCGPVRVDRKAESANRAHRPCRCGGWLWDWGCGWNGYADVITWLCDRCPREYAEYVTSERLTEIRSPKKGLAA